LFGAKGFRVLRAASSKRNEVSPRRWSVPGLVKISIRPKPSRSYSAENGFAFSRI